MDVRGILKNASPGGQKQPIAPTQVAAGQSIEPPMETIVKEIAPVSTRETVIQYVPEPSTSKARFVKRPDISQEEYREQPNTSTYQIYNDTVDDFLKSFSRNNSKHRGGAKITPSMLIEALVDTAFYDLGLTPDGFSNVEEIREFIRSKMK